MPGKDGTGPLGTGPTTGRGRGGMAAGPSGFCVCPRCGEKVRHMAGVPCTSQKCPKCGSPMVRDAS